MNAVKLDRVWAIAAREVAAIRKSRALWLPMTLVPLILFVVMPVGIALVTRAAGSEGIARDVEELLARLPPDLVASLPLDRPAAALVEVLLRQMLAPMFVLVPVMTATLVAADAFAGERERRTLEALLHTPVTDVEIFAGKVLGAFAPALATCVLGLALVSVAVDVATYSLVGRLLLPDPLWLAMALVLAPAAAGLAVLVLVFVSARVKGFQEATQLGGLVVLPIVGVLVAQGAGVMYLRPLGVLAVGVALLALDVGLVIVVGKSFRRDDLFARL